MTSELQLSKVEAINFEVQALSPDELQDIDSLNTLLLRFTSFLAFTGEQMAIAKRIWRQEQSKAYESFVFSRMANGNEIRPQMAKDYVNAKCGNYESIYEFIERTNRALTHTIDAIRTCISALKEQLKNLNV